MEVPLLPDSITVGEVFVLQTRGPVYTRRTDVVQRPQAALVWDKTSYDELWVGAGLPLTICHVPVVLPTGDEAQAEFARWRDEAYSAAGVLSAALDDRVAQYELFNDFLIFDDGEWTGLADKRLGVRNYLPFLLTDEDVTKLDELDGDDVPPNIAIAARWYLRGAQTGPAADGIPLFFTALEAIVGAGGRDVVAKVEDALREAGINPEDYEPQLGPTFGVRGNIVHRGEVDLERVVPAWYVLETACRSLLQHALGLQLWPSYPGETAVLDTETREEWEASVASPQSYFHDPE